MESKRKNYTPEEKIAILKKHILEAISLFEKIKSPVGRFRVTEPSFRLGGYPRWNSGSI